MGDMFVKNSGEDFAVREKVWVRFGPREVDTPFVVDALSRRVAGGRRIQWAQTAVVSYG